MYVKHIPGVKVSNINFLPLKNFQGKIQNYIFEMIFKKILKYI